MQTTVMANSAANGEARGQAVTGVVSPLVAEATIRETWPSVWAMPAIARVGAALTRTILLAPLAWLLLLLAFGKTITPFVAKLYRLTNRRVAVIRFPLGKVLSEVALADIEDVRIQSGSYSDFYRAGTLEIISQGKPALELPGVREPESFRRAILNARAAWAPPRPPTDRQADGPA